MILAAGRGERMRPLSDTTPKPLLEAGGKPLILWQLERLVAAGFTEVVNVAHRGEAIAAALGDGSRFGATINYSLEPEPLEVGGGIATALPLLGDGMALIVSGDVYAEYDYASLRAPATAMDATSAPPQLHMVMVPNPGYDAGGDFSLADGRFRARWRVARDVRKSSRFTAPRSFREPGRRAGETQNPAAVPLL